MAALDLVFPNQLGVSSIPTFSFDSAQFTNGFPLVDPVYELQLLMSNSVNASRERLNRFDYPQFTIRAVKSEATFAAAIYTARYLRGLKGFYCNFKTTLQGVEYDFSSYTFYLIEVAGTPVPGPFFGGAVADAQGHASVELILRRTI